MPTDTARMTLPQLIVVHSANEPPPPLQPTGYMNEWKTVDYLVTPLAVFKFLHINVLNRGGREVPVLAVRSDDPSLAAFSFPTGRPAPKVVYERHEVDPTRYLLPATKDEVQLTEQVNAYCEAYAALGARQITIEVTSETTSKGRVGVRSSGDTFDLGIDAGAGSVGEAKASIVLPGHPPRRLPRNPWLATPRWRSIESMRVRDGMTEYDWSTNFAASKDRSFNASIATALKDLDLGAGGEYRALDTTTYQMNAIF